MFFVNTFSPNLKGQFCSTARKEFECPSTAIANGEWTRSLNELKDHRNTEFPAEEIKTKPANTAKKSAGSKAQTNGNEVVN